MLAKRHVGIPVCSPTMLYFSQVRQNIVLIVQLERLTGIGWNILVDVLLAIIPATIVWGLNMPKRKRLGLVAILSPGLAAAVCGIVKVNFLAGLNARSDLTCM